MEKQRLEVLIAAGHTQRGIATETGFSQTTIRYWLGRYGLKTKSGRSCRYCESPIDRASRNARACTKCRNQKYIRRWERLKEQAIADKGGRCEICGYDRYRGALDFHHVDPTQKGAEWTTVKKWSKDRRNKELAKCVLLCSNCHREVHAGVTQWQSVGLPSRSSRVRISPSAPQ